MKQQKLKICIKAWTDQWIFVGGGGLEGGPGPSVIKKISDNGCLALF